jgi:dipeptidyl aminopeptidase/acylaminoacyl peptidase
MNKQFCTLVLLCSPTLAQETYKQPPKQILEVLDAPATPYLSVSPARDHALLIEPLRYPPIADVAQPMLRLAGLRINPANNGPRLPLSYTALTLKRIADGAETKIVLPPGARIGSPEWSPDGRHLAFTNSTPGAVELWVAETATGKARRLDGLNVNAAYGDPLAWMPGSQQLLARLVPAGRGKPPARPGTPPGPTIQETSGKPAPVRTYQDLLTSPHDEDLFDYYTTSQLTLVDVANGRITPVGRPAIFQSSTPAPDGRHLLVVRVHRPYSYLDPVFAFPKDVEVWDRSGKTVYQLASLPLADSVPIEGVPTGPRYYHWQPTAPATLVWAEALDGGDPRKKVEHRDVLRMLSAPFAGSPLDLTRTEHRFAGIAWTEKDPLAFVDDYDRDRRWVRTMAVSPENPSQPARVLWSLNARDRYRHPGSPVQRTLANGHRAILQKGDSIFLFGTGASPEGDRPFLDRFDLKTLKAERLFRSDNRSFEAPVALLDEEGARFITRRETPAEPPNYYVRDRAGQARPLTSYPDPTPQLRAIRKQLVTYRRPDGVQLSFTLYLPPGYQEGTRLPTVIWAYPLEYNDPATAGQVSGSTQRFTSILGASHLFYLLAGYAILDNASMPVVGDPETMNNTYVEQIVASAKAAIDKAVEMGVTDRDRVGVGGHSYGAFMTANLLAHSDLFRAGVARSGAYNRTLTPFGFQSERRTLWEAPDVYVGMSPFLHAHKIKEPLLLIHGEADDNAGTFPIQSERMYHAVRGNGGTVRLVTLPHESHGYAARESIEHTLYEMISWFDQHVKEAPPRS